jgi:hypothetical protein
MSELAEILFIELVPVHSHENVHSLVRQSATEQPYGILVDLP